MAGHSLMPPHEGLHFSHLGKPRLLSCLLHRGRMRSLLKDKPFTLQQARAEST